MTSFGLFLLRLTTGGLMMGHGSQKLFGWFGGNGLHGTAGYMESLKLKPGHPWAVGAGASEFGGGLLTALGLFSPLGSLGTIGAMTMAWLKTGRGKPIWISQGGPELPLTNILIATSLLLTGPGALSLDRAFKIKIPRWFTLAGFVSMAGTLALAYAQEQQQLAAEQAQQQNSITIPLTSETRDALENEVVATIE